MFTIFSPSKCKFYKGNNFFCFVYYFVFFIKSFYSYVVIFNNIFLSRFLPSFKKAFPLSVLINILYFKKMIYVFYAYSIIYINIKIRHTLELLRGWFQATTRKQIKWIVWFPEHIKVMLTLHCSLLSVQ